ncbi:MAG: hypothetical protein PHD19_11655 [Dechloromonas sp.]|nr:hypothetical protein [Dechloromonas sp.]
MSDRALLSIRLTVDHDDAGPGVPARPVYAYVKLYREADGLVWRIDGPLGDECEALPRPPSAAQAKADARLVYPQHSPFKARASWL